MRGDETLELRSLQLSGAVRAMSQEPVSAAIRLIESLSASDQRLVFARLRELHPIHTLEALWGASAEVILEAIARASDLSHRGVLGLIAEAAFKVNVIDRLEGWTNLEVPGDAAFDFLIEKGTEKVRIQVKRQRLERKVPKRRRRGSELFVVETQRTRTGTSSTGASTRPYRFGEFDILAVSMQPVTRDWSRFSFAPQSWLLPRPDDPTMLRVFQPVSLPENEDWAGSLQACIQRLRSGVRRTIAER